MAQSGSSARKARVEKDKSKAKSKGKSKFKGKGKTKGKGQKKKKGAQAVEEDEEETQLERYKAIDEVKRIRDEIQPMSLRLHAEYALLQTEVASLEVQLADCVKDLQRREKGEKAEEIEEEQQSEPGEWHPIWVAIYVGENRIAYKHWALFVEDEMNASKGFICHVMGVSRNYRYEQKHHNAHESNKMVEVIPVSYVHRDDLKKLRTVAKFVPIKNEDPTWNCQDFVLQLLEVLVVEGIIDDDEFRKGRKIVYSRMEGLI